MIKADLRLEELEREKTRVNSVITNNEFSIKGLEEKIENNKKTIVKIKEEEEKEKIYKIYLEAYGKNGVSKIVNMLKRGAPVVTTRAHVQHIITEHGSVDLYGKNLKERAKLMISIAHPDHREQLSEDVFECFKIFI